LEIAKALGREPKRFFFAQGKKKLQQNETKPQKESKREKFHETDKSLSDAF
jgi:hypothetical protein